jgi:hypothetical protein
LRRVRIRRARVGGAIVLVLLLVVLVDPGHAGFGGLLARVLGGGSASATTALATSAGVSFDPVLGLPVTGGHGIAGERGPVVIGDSPQETAGEVWAYGRIGDVPAIVAGKSYANHSSTPTPRRAGRSCRCRRAPRVKRPPFQGRSDPWPVARRPMVV